MLKIAIDKVQNKSGKNSIIGSKAVNLEEKEWYQDINGPFDAIVTAYVLEHLKEPDYRAVIKKCREYLRPGGVFISVEWSDDEYGMKDWFWKKMVERGKKHDEYKTAIEEFIRLETHYFVNITQKLEWIREAGYKNVHTVWQNLFGYIVVSEK